MFVVPYLKLFICFKLFQNIFTEVKVQQLKSSIFKANLQNLISILLILNKFKNALEKTSILFQLSEEREYKNKCSFGLDVIKKVRKRAFISGIYPPKTFSSVWALRRNAQRQDTRIWLVLFPPLPAFLPSLHSSIRAFY